MQARCPRSGILLRDATGWALSHRLDNTSMRKQLPGTSRIASPLYELLDTTLCRCDRYRIGVIAVTVLFMPAGCRVKFTFSPTLSFFSKLSGLALNVIVIAGQ